MNNNKKSVFRNLILITQLGLHVIVPTGLCVAAGVIIDKHFGTYWIIPLMIIGMLAGGRNAYRLAMASAKEDENYAEKHSGEKKEND